MLCCRIPAWLALDSRAGLAIANGWWGGALGWAVRRGKWAKERGKRGVSYAWANSIWSTQREMSDGDPMRVASKDGA